MSDSLPVCEYCNGILHDNEGRAFTCNDCPITAIRKERMNCVETEGEK
jgi:hypothetical protein